MLQHIVMYWLHDNSPEAVARCVTAFEGMRGKIPGLLSLHAGADVVHSERSCDLCLCTVFESREALDAYRTHPAHLPVKAHMHAAMARSCSADFVFDAPGGAL